MGKDITSEVRKPKIVATYGTFDMFHFGHERILKRAKEHGDYLIVGVSSDEYVLEKGKKPIQTLEERVKYVESLPYVDKVIVEYTTDEQ